MTPSEIQQQRQLLIALARHLGKNVSELERETDELRTKQGDYAQGQDMSDYQEVSNQAAEEYVTKHLLGNQEFTLSEIEAALDRIKAGTYGKCVECKSTIDADRMKALPYARRCIQCAKSFHG
ncbi:MAG TPA: TraR/DksA family transcriptional regulator [Gemmatales bacterium]|nr:TraR/DksA family transcriptional regulator [Gemmatales bacterium]